MHRALQTLRSGDWLIRERIRLVAVVLLIASVAGFLFLMVTAHGNIDRQGRPLGTDFSNVYAAGTYVLDGNPDAPFDPPTQYAREQTIFGRTTPFYGWHYPPYFLFIADALAKMPYGLALAIWQASTLLLYLLMMRGIGFPSPRVRGEGGERQSREPNEGAPTSAQKRGNAPSPGSLRDIAMLCIAFFTKRGRPEAALASPRAAGRGDYIWLLLALAYPAVLINIGHGQNGFLTAALLGGALVILDRRPAVAGILIGLLVYKPQFGLMIPLALIAGGYWRTFVAAAVTVVVLTIVTTLVFGPDVWHAFMLSTKFSRTVVLEQGQTGWQKIQSVFSWARMWGAPVPLAYVVQGTITVVLGVAIIRLWRSAASRALKSAGLCLAAILATPYSLDYDMMVLAPSIAFFSIDGLARGFRPWEKTALAALWLVPLVTRSIAQATLVPLGVPAMLAVFILVMRRVELDRRSAVAFAGAPTTIAQRG
ncbi:MAG: glycosyltransferase family 87 protein [Xanthobacteraceae bacterium]